MLRMKPGTKLTNEGIVVRRDETRFGLHRACIQLNGRYPDLEAWAALIPNPQVWRHRYTERLDPVLGCKCYLWLYWKE